MTNRLAQETSPYLQQHAENPVDWYPWGEEALARARRENKPILLSVGYSACHWCHVMAQESFEDAEVAALMNRLFINIKVDREERPDIDQIYQSAHQMLTQRAGGWPLTMFLAPDGGPYFGGTYFPKAPRYGLPGLPDLLQRVEVAFRQQRGAIDEQNQALTAALARSLPGGSTHRSSFDRAPIDALARLLRSSFDEVHGGFGQAPKFPHPTDLDFLLRCAVSLGKDELRDIALTTLTKMAEGGIYDQLGGGFCRYSVDGQWAIPHFEKMLYDNAQLLALYADAWVLTGRPLFARVAEETAAWVMREMQAPEAGYYSSLDADSEHVEGKFYVWDRAALRGVLDDRAYALLSAHYGLDRPPNFEGEHWHLHVAKPLHEVSASLGLTLVEAERLLTAARQKLVATRELRIRPGRDDKILSSWNALMIAAMARASRLLGKPEWLDSARRALDFIRTTLWEEAPGGGRLLATCKDGRAHLNAYLDDYAFLLAAQIELMQADFRADDLAFAETLADALLERFEDHDGGGFFFTSHDHEQLIHRGKPGHDNATPAGNGVAALALQRLAHISGETRFSDAAERTLACFYAQFDRQPGGYASLLTALEEYLLPPTVVVVRGAADALAPFADEVNRRYLPGTFALSIGADGAGLPPALDKPVAVRVNAFVCRGVQCLSPIDTPEALGDALGDAQQARILS